MEAAGLTSVGPGVSMLGLHQFGAGSQASRAMTDGMYTALQEAGNLPDWA